jgi:hypothetical protein
MAMQVYVVQAIANTDWMQFALAIAAILAAALALDRYCSPFPGKPNRRQ